MSDPSAFPEDQGADLDLIALVEATAAQPPAGAGLAVEHAAIIRLCQSALTVAELTAYLDLPLSTVRALLGDLVERDLIVVCDAHLTGPGPSQHVLKAVINGLRSL
jgi:hypothetical protein